MALGERHEGGGGGGGAAAGHGEERGEERATPALPSMGMLRKAKNRQQTEEGGGSRKQACRVWPGRTPHWHLENDTQEEELQQDMAKS